MKVIEKIEMSIKKDDVFKKPLDITGPLPEKPTAVHTKDKESKGNSSSTSGTDSKKPSGKAKVEPGTSTVPATSDVSKKEINEEQEVERRKLQYAILVKFIFC